MMPEHSTTTSRPQSRLSELATEHLLCTSCKEAIAACSVLQSPEKPPRGKSLLCSYADRKALESAATMCPTPAAPHVPPCHLCSLIVGRIRQAEFWRQPPEDPPPPPEPINVYFTVGRTGGITLEIEIGESSRHVGYLVVVPADDEEVISVPATPDNPFFTFSPTSLEGSTPDVYRSARLAKSLASEASFSLAREWLKQCLDSHARCTEAAGLAVGRPYRLVDVGDENPGADPKIIVVDLSRPVPPYLTLSHCWGGAEILRLLLGNMDALMKGISMHKLPKTFQDAVIITRRLGYQYIWIDSLCIIQDSEPDWKTNAAIMGEIYAGSVCTVAALTARNAYDGGCFFEQARNPLSYRHCQFAPYWTVQANSYLAPDMRLRPSWSPLEPFPLHTRAWVVQERLLAPRTLYYGSTGLAWECAECSATENVPHGEVSGFSPKASFFEIMRQIPTDQGEEVARDGPDLELQEKVHDLWMTILAAYGRCSLTRFNDRLVAVSGVLKRIEATTGWRNMWGIWRKSVLVDLLWFVDNPSVRPSTPGYLAPTWSWAGLKGRVFTAVGDGKGCEWAAEVVDDGVLQDGRGYVKLKAMAKQMTLTAQGKLYPASDDPQPSWAVVDWMPDERVETINASPELRCILITRQTDYLGQGVPILEMGLVVANVGGHDEVWARLGMFIEPGDLPVPLFPSNPDEVERLTHTVVVV